MKQGWRWRDVTTFLIFLGIFTGIGASLVVVSGKLFGAERYYVRMLMWSPAMAAFATALVAKKSLREFGWKWGESRWQLLSWLTPLLYVSLSYIILWGAGWGKVPNPEFMEHAFKSVSLPISAGAAAALLVAFTATFGMLDFGGALGEEVGWRGFLVPALYQLTGSNFTATTLINGVIWALWHAPIIFLSSYNNPGVPRWYSFACFFVLIVSSATIDDWYRIKSGSLWTGVILHTSHNLYVQLIFTPLTANTDKTRYFIDEFGAVLPLVMLVFAIYFWSRREELTSNIQAKEIGATAGL